MAVRCIAILACVHITNGTTSGTIAGGGRQRLGNGQGTARQRPQTSLVRRRVGAYGDESQALDPGSPLSITLLTGGRMSGVTSAMSARPGHKAKFAWTLAILGIIGSATRLSPQASPAVSVGLSSQASPAVGVTPGERIRVKGELTAPTKTKYGEIETATTTEKGTVAWVRADTIGFRVDGGRQDGSGLVAVPLGHIERLDKSVGEHRNTVTGLWIGALSGAALGAATMAIATPTHCNAASFGAAVACGLYNNPGTNAAAGAIVGGAAGLVLGAGIGTLIKTEKWARVPGYPIPAVTVVALPHGVGYGLAFDF
jgi:hypothetical protein